MPLARKHQVSLDATPYYHCVSRCVRRAFLCGHDDFAGRNYEHRRQWLEDRLLELAGIFAIDVCAFAIMSNHYHVVLHINAAMMHRWSNKEVCQRWHRLFKGTLLTQAYLQGKPLDNAQQQVVDEKIAEWRLKLGSVSWFMRCLNEPIARRANEQDRCTGRFWEGRFKSQALLDEKALAACMAYVDLNPIRAKMAETPEASSHTSIQARINAVKQKGEQPISLYPFVGNPRESMPAGLPFQLQDYLNLVDLTGKAIRDDKRGFINNDLPPILERLDIEPKQWLYLTTQFESRFKNMVGATYALRRAARKMGYRRTPGLAENEILLC